MKKAYNSAITIASVLIQNDSTLSFTVDCYESRRGYFLLVISRKNKPIVSISFFECLGYLKVFCPINCEQNFNDAIFEVEDSDKMLTYIFNILEAYKVVA